jgi:hypothetical protein
MEEAALVRLRCMRRIFPYFCFMLLALPFSAAGQTGTPCNAFQSGSVPPAGYGAAWNPFNTAQGLLLNSNCSGASVELHVETGDFNTQYVYKQGYVYAGGWQPFTLSGNFLSGSTDWLQGQGRYVSSSISSNPMFWVGYMCHWDPDGKKWSCGCRDSVCSTNYWQLQGVSQSGGTAGGGTTAGTGGSTVATQGFTSCGTNPTKPLPSFNFGNAGYQGGAPIPNRPATITFPAGRITMDKQTFLESGDIVRGAGRDKTILYFPKGLK